MPKPRIVLYDLETSHNLAAVFQLKQQDNYIPYDNIIQERYIICASWKVLGEKAVHAVSVLDDPKRFAKHPQDDFHVCTVLHQVLSESDVIVAHNGDQFDQKFVAARFLIHGLDPLPPITSIDTLTVARSRFLFNANHLDYLGNILKVGRKKPTTGGLWLRVLKGDASAVREMVKYNKQDVALLERVFLKLRPYMANHVNRELYGEQGCPRCGSRRVQARGLHRAISRAYQRWHCQACGGWYKSVKADPIRTTKRTL